MVKCVDCGFLAIKSQINRQLDEVEATYRQRGKEPLRGNGVIHEEPECYMKSYNLQDEFHNNEGGSNTRWTNIFNKERECTSFFQWRQGLTPKEHREMMDRQEWRNWQEKQHKENIKWRIIELIFLVIGAGLFTLLGAYIARGGR